MKSPCEIQEIMDRLRDLHIETPSYDQLKDNLARLFRKDADGMPTHVPVRFTAGTETHGVIMISGPGAGKTTDMRRAVLDHKALAHNPETGVARHIHLTVASPATLRSLACQFLKELGIEGISDRIKVHELWTMIRHRLQRLGISLVVVDEAHDMFRATTGSEADAMFRMMKSLMQGEHPVVLLLGGTERLLDITRMDAQVNRRFYKVLAPRLEVGSDTNSIRDVITFYAKRAGLRADLEEDLVVRLMHGARYRLGRCIEIILTAIEEALLNGNDTVGREDFAIAFALNEGCHSAANVFVVDNFMAVAFEDDDEIGNRMQEARDQKARAKTTAKSKRGNRAA
jgi:hypothetical protein